MHGKLYLLSVVLMTTSVLSGCKTNTATTLQPREHPDPLCVSKKPIEGKPHDPTSDAVVRVDPQPPPLPGRASGVIVQQPASLGTPQPLSLPFE